MSRGSVGILRALVARGEFEESEERTERESLTLRRKAKKERSLSIDEKLEGGEVPRKPSITEPETTEWNSIEANTQSLNAKANQLNQHEPSSQTQERDTVRISKGQKLLQAISKESTSLIDHIKALHQQQESMRKSQRDQEEKEWNEEKASLHTLKDQLLRVMESFETEQKATEKRMEEFARNKLTEKKKLQSQLDSTRQLLTHLKLSLEHSQREAEALRTQLKQQQPTSEESKREEVQEDVRADLEKANADLEVETASLRDQNANLQTMNQALESKVKDLNEVLNVEREMHVKAVDSRDRKLVHLNQTIEKLNEELQQKDLQLEQHTQAFEQQRQRFEHKLIEKDECVLSLKAEAESMSTRLSETQKQATELLKKLESSADATDAMKKTADVKQSHLKDRITELEKELCSLEVVRNRLQQDVSDKDDLLTQEKDRAENLQHQVDALSKELEQVKDKHTKILLQEREVFRHKINAMELELLQQQRHSQQSASNVEMEKQVVTYQEEIRRLLGELQKTSSKQDDTSQRLEQALKDSTLAKGKVKALQEALAQETKTLAELRHTALAEQSDMSAERERLKDLLESLGRVFRACDLLEGDLTCMECFNLFDSPVFVLPTETNYCAKCIPSNVENSETFSIHANRTVDNIAEKFSLLRHSLSFAKQLASQFN